MKIAAARVHRFDLPLREPHVTGAGTISLRAGSILEIVDEDGVAGFGEAAPLSAPGTEAFESVLAGLDRVALTALDRTFEELSQNRRRLAGSSPIVAAALDTALLDRRGRRENVPLARLLAPSPASSVAVNALVTTSDPTNLAAQVVAAVGAGFGTVKLKVAAAGPSVDVERIRLARDAAGADVRLRLDANRAWDLATATEVLTAAHPFDIDYVEEPLASPADLAALHRRTGIALAADESLASGDDLDPILAAGLFEVAVLKPSLLGGPTATVDLGRRCAGAGIGVVISSALDAAVGLCAALHVAAAIEHRGAAGLATSSILATDVAVAPEVRQGALVPTGPGLGLESLQL